MNTPWGKSQSITKIQFGVSWVSTAGHGGLMVSAGQAEKLFDSKVIDTAYPGRFAGYVCFEEDCSYAVAFLAHPEWKRYLDKLSLAEWENSVFDSDSYMGRAKSESVPKLQAEIAKTDEQIRADMAEIVRYWYPEYFGLPRRESQRSVSTAV
jgi:hypothetical protein